MDGPNVGDEEPGLAKEKSFHFNKSIALQPTHTQENKVAKTEENKANTYSQQTLVRHKSDSQ